MDNVQSEVHLQILLLGGALMMLAMLWLAYVNYCPGHRKLRRNVAGHIAWIGATALLTVGLQVRAWELLLGGPEALPALPPKAGVRPSVSVMWMGVVALNPDGTLWMVPHTHLETGDPASSGRALVADSRWLQVEANNSRIYAIREDGTLWEWPRSNQNGTVEFEPPATTFQLSPLNLGSDWQTIGIGDRHIAALRRDGTLWTWGDNEAGQLGTGDTEWRRVPTRVPGTSRWVAVAAARSATIAADSTGTVYLWGIDNKIAASHGARTYLPAPVASGNDWTRLFAGGDVFYGIDGQGVTWALRDLFPWVTTAQSQRVVPQSSQPWRDVSCSWSSARWIDASGRLWAGRRTNPDSALSVVDKARPLGSRSDWIAIDQLGGWWCGLTSDGQLWQWGRSSLTDDGQTAFSDLLPPRQRPRSLLKLTAVGSIE
jgi:alpha-tubulin suppressor-like RCC1 family protein